MNLNANNIEKGMDVFGADGEKIGTIADVYSGAASGDTAGGYDTGGSSLGTQGMGNSGLVVEEVDVVEVAPDYTAGTGDTGTTSGAGLGGASGTGTSGTTWNAGPGSTGDIGTVGTAYDQNTSPGYVPGGTSVGTMTGSGYLHVEQGGILGIGAKDLYIPMSVVQDIDPSNCVSLSITKQQADDNYQTKPDFLDSESS